MPSEIIYVFTFKETNLPGLSCLHNSAGPKGASPAGKWPFLQGNLFSCVVVGLCPTSAMQLWLRLMRPPPMASNWVCCAFGFALRLLWYPDVMSSLECSLGSRLSLCDVGGLSVCPCTTSPPPQHDFWAAQAKAIVILWGFFFLFLFFFCKNFLQQKFFFTFEFQTIVNTQICFCPFSFLFFGTSSPNWFSAKLWMIQGATNAQCYQAFKFEYGIPRFEPRYMDPVLREWQGGLRFPDWTGGSSLKSGQRVSMSSIWLELCSGHQTKVEVTPLVPSLLS